ncbi:MAG: ATP-binding protein [Cyanobacteriota bacterium]
MKKNIFIATGAYDCGKTTTLKYLRANYGVKIHKEAHLIVLEKLGNKINGHAPDKPFEKILANDHFCPMCNPLEFAEMVLEEQLTTEKLASNGDFIERGYIDPLEYYLRNSNQPEWTGKYSKRNFLNYSKVFLFNVIAATQVPRWGKTAEIRIKEAHHINERLHKMYSNAGFDICTIPDDSVENRAKMILDLICH